MQRKARQCKVGGLIETEFYSNRFIDDLIAIPWLFHPMDCGIPTRHKEILYYFSYLWNNTIDKRIIRAINFIRSRYNIIQTNLLMI